MCAVNPPLFSRKSLNHIHQVLKQVRYIHEGSAFAFVRNTSWLLMQANLTKAAAPLLAQFVPGGSKSLNMDNLAGLGE